MHRFFVYMSFLMIFLLLTDGCTYINNIFKKTGPRNVEVTYESPEVTNEYPGKGAVERETGGRGGVIESGSRPFPNIEIDENKYIIHTLKQGETLSFLSQHYYGDFQKYTLIAWFNDIFNVDKIYAGQKIEIPVIKNMRTLEPPEEISDISEIKKSEGESSVPDKKVEEDSLSKELLPTEPEEVTKEWNMEISDAPELETERESFSEKSKSSEPIKAKKVDEQQLSEKYEKGVDFFKQEKYYEARNEFKNIIDVNPSYQSAQKYYDISEKIIFSIQKGTRFYYAEMYESSFDEFKKIATLNKSSVIALNYLNKLIPLIIKEAKLDLKDRHKPCTAINLLNKVLSHEPNNNEAKSLLQEANVSSQKMNLKCR